MSLVDTEVEKELETLLAMLKRITKTVEAMKKEIIIKDEIRIFSGIDKEMKMVDLSEIVGISTTAMRKWDNVIRSGIRLSSFYSFVKQEKPEYLGKVEAYIKKENAKILNRVDIKKTGS